MLTDLKADFTEDESMPSVFITGSNRGLGLELARQSLDDGWRVIATCRDPDTATDLKSLDGDISIHRLDVADFGQIESVAKDIGDEPLDILFLNAGLNVPANELGERDAKLGTVNYEDWHHMFWVNSIAPLKIVECLLPNVERGERKLIVGVSSRLGSISQTTHQDRAFKHRGPVYPYRTTKAALNAVMHVLALELMPKGITVVPLNPGWVRTDMGGPTAVMEADESIRDVRRLMAKFSAEDSGTFFEHDGSIIPW